MAKSLIFVVNLFSSSYSLMMLVALWRRTASSWTRTGSAQHCRRRACRSSPSEPQWNPSVAVWWSGWWAQGGRECCQSKSLIWFPGWRSFSQSLHSFHLSRKSCHTWYSGSLPDPLGYLLGHSASSVPSSHFSIYKTDAEVRKVFLFLGLGYCFQRGMHKVHKSKELHG